MAVRVSSMCGVRAAAPGTCMLVGVETGVVWVMAWFTQGTRSAFEGRRRLIVG